MKKIFAIVGKTCAGKDTVVKELVKRKNMSVATSFTTRPKRANETDGVEYNFITRDSFLKKVLDKEVVEFTDYTVANGETWYYGLTREELEKDDYVLAIVNPAGVKILKRKYGDKVSVIYITADDKTRLKRYLDRDTSNNVAECCRRFLADETDFADITYDLMVANNVLDDTVRAVESYISRCKGNDIVKKTEREFKRNPFGFLRR